jgi:hypothetical protein
MRPSRGGFWYTLPGKEPCSYRRVFKEAIVPANKNDMALGALNDA